MSEFKITLAAARVNAGLTQADVAKMLHVTNRTILNWEKGIVIPSLATLHALSCIYKIPEDYIFLPCQST